MKTTGKTVQKVTMSNRAVWHGEDPAWEGVGPASEGIVLAFREEIPLWVYSARTGAVVGLPETGRTRSPRDGEPLGPLAEAIMGLMVAS